MKTTTLCLAVSFLVAVPAFAANYFVVVPVKGRTAANPPISAIEVSLNAYTLPGAVEGSAYSFNLAPLLTVTGDNAYTGSGVTWNVVSNTLPSGLYLTADGYIGGTPTASGTGSITVRATYKNKNGEQTYQVVSAALTVSLASATLPVGRVNQAYNYDFKPLATSNDPTFSGSKASFSATGLPTGLSLAANGVLSGTPTVKNESGAAVQVVASYKGKDGQRVYTLVINGITYEITGIAAGSFHSCMLTAAGGVKCWGRDSAGQLGDDATLAEKLTPVDVQGLTSGVKSLAVGDDYSCALTTAGAVKCWGGDVAGQLGNGAPLTASPVPVDVVGLSSGVVNISAGLYSVCATTNTGTVKCWGKNNNGQLGDRTTTDRPAPVDVVGLTGVTQVSVGHLHACALTNSNGVKCWGDDTYGQLGNDATAASSNAPVDVAGLTSGVAVLDAGRTFNCVVTTSGGAKCWGDDYRGQLGNDAAWASKYTPVDVSGLTSGVESISSGGAISCAVLTTGAVRCWGYDNVGQLGNDATAASSGVPVQVSGIESGARYISVGDNHVCAMLDGNLVKCWGYNNYGQLGDNSKVNRFTPVLVVQP